MKNQRIVYYTQLDYQLLGTNSDIQTYAEFCSAFDNLATACRARGQAFERIYIDVPAMLRWLRDNGHMPLARAVILLCTGFRLAALPMSKHRTMTDQLTVHPLMYLPKHHEEEICNGPV